MKSTPTRLPATAYQAIGAFRHALTRYDHRSERYIRGAGLTPQQYALLVVLGGAGEVALSLGEAAQALSITHTSAVGLSQRAERAGLLVRVPGPSRRHRTLLHLTGAGAGTLDAVTGELIDSLDGERLELLEALARWRGVLAAGRLETGAGADAPPAHVLAPAGPGERDLVWQLLQLHLYELSVYHGEDTDEQGEYAYGAFSGYWQGEPQVSYLVRVSGRPAGFALVRRRDDPGAGLPWHDLTEFSILRKHRGRHLGSRVAGELLRTRPGRWSVSFHERNQAARAFWQAVVRRHATGRAREERREDDPRLGTRLTFEVAA